MSVEPFVSKPGNAYVASWAKLGSVWVSAEPLIDGATVDQPDAPRYCRFTWKEANEAATLLGCRLPTAAEIDAIRDDALSAGGIRCDCHTLPDADMIKAAGVAFPNWRDPASVAAYQAAVQHMLNESMAGAAWCALHDARVRADLQRLGFDGTRVALNAGKWYCKGLSAEKPGGPPSGRAWLKGWWLLAAAGVSAHWIQRGPVTEGDYGPHSDEGSRDDGTTTIVVSDAEPMVTAGGMGG